MAHLCLHLLGSLQILLDSQPVTAFESDKVRALLVYLALESDRPHSREMLAGLLWPELPDNRARQNLSQALFNLRHALSDHGAPSPFLYVTRECLQFNRASNHWIDAAAFTACLAGGAHEWGPGRLEEAVALYRGPLLAGSSLSRGSWF